MATPFEILKDAIKAVPVVRYALGIAGIASAGAIIRSFYSNMLEAIFVIILLLVLMVVLIVIARLGKSSSSSTKKVAAFLAWAATVLTIAATILLSSALFFDWPKPIYALLTLKDPKKGIPDYAVNVVQGYPVGQCKAEERGSAVQLFKNGWLLDRFDENTIYAIVKTKDGTVEWYKKQSDYVKGNERDCIDVEKQQLIRLGFRWYYCSPDQAEIRQKLGPPIAKETRAWVQYHEWSKGLLIFGLPGSTETTSDFFQILYGYFLEDWRKAQGQGKYFHVSDANLQSNFLCSVLWYPADKERNLPQMIRELSVANRCGTIKGPDEYTKPRDNCSFGF